MTLPGDKTKKEKLASMIMVNHAGEYGAKRIYQGQLDYIKDNKAKEEITHMAAQEEEHLKYFSKQIVKEKLRPTFLMPLWHCFGYGLGMITARLGVSSAMICTQAVEEVIDKHYEDQLNDLESIKEKSELKKMIQKFQQEELEHRDTALEYLKENPANLFKNKILKKFIGSFCKIAISLSKRI